MVKIPSNINGVNIEFAPGVNNEVEKHLLEGLKHCIKKTFANTTTLTSIYIASASDSHIFPSRHAQGKAVDISRINGTKIILGYPGTKFVKLIVDAIQTTFESYSGRRENFGPFLKKKNGSTYSVSGHLDHIHLSVD
jgi:hypothetical protein